MFVDNSNKVNLISNRRNKWRYSASLLAENDTWEKNKMNIKLKNNRIYYYVLINKSSIWNEKIFPDLFSVLRACLKQNKLDLNIRFPAKIKQRKIRESGKTIVMVV